MSRGKELVRLVFFFFQAEDGIRDYKVTGVQTCALPILVKRRRQALKQQIYAVSAALWIVCAAPAIASWLPWMRPTVFHSATISLTMRSLFGSELGSESSAGRYDGYSIGTLRPIYQQLANVSNPGRPRPYC